jgi:hypothetical protein
MSRIHGKFPHAEFDMIPIKLQDIRRVLAEFPTLLSVISYQSHIFLWTISTNMIMGHTKKRLEHEMIRTIGLLSLVSILAAGLCAGEAKALNGKLIPVELAEPAQPQVREVSPDPNTAEGYQMPAPKDQLYVFWVAGKILSFPVDLAESLIRKVKGKPKPQAGSPVQASSQPSNSPFDNLNWREIPPAPPASELRTR